MSDDSMQEVNSTIYRDFCNGMKNQSREQLRIAGDIARRISRGTHQSKPLDSLTTSLTNFCQVEPHLENIENNLNKVCALTRQSTR